MTRVIHFVYDKDLAEMEERIQTNVSEKYYISHLYQTCNYEIAQVFRKHFSLNNDFNVKFVTSLSTKSEKKNNLKNKSDDNDFISKQIKEWMLDKNYDFDNNEHRKLFLKNIFDKNKKIEMQTIKKEN